MAKLESAYWSYVDGLYSIALEAEDYNSDLPRIDKDCMRFNMTAKEFVEFAKAVEFVLRTKRYVHISDGNVKNKYRDVVQKYHNDGYTLATKTEKYTVFIGLMTFTNTHDLLVIDLVQNELYTGFMGASHIGFKVNKL